MRTLRGLRSTPPRAALALAILVGPALLAQGPAEAGHAEPPRSTSDHHSAPAADAPPPVDRRDLGLVYQGLRRVSSGPCAGLFAITATDGMCSHGPDAPFLGLDPTESVRSEAPATSGAESLAAGACEGDGISGNRVQALYVHGTTDRFAEYQASLLAWTSGIDDIYSASAQETGGVRHVRFVTEPAGAGCRPSLVSVRVEDAALGSFGATITALQAAGYDRSDRKYVLWVDANVYCGIGGFAGDDRKTAGNWSNFGPSYGRSDSGCWTSGVAAHELGHNLGAVNDSAPNTSHGGHCVDEYDVMCYSDAPNYPAMRFDCPDPSADLRLDCRHDDYYSTNPPPGSYLSSHFNVADNDFLIIGGGSGGGDTTSPSVPSGLTAGSVGTGSVTLAWTAAQDDVGVTAYDVLRDGGLVTSTGSTSVVVQGLAPATTYAFTVVARDAAGNESGPSGALQVTTSTPPAAALVAGRTGFLTNAASGLAAQVAGSRTTDGAPVVATALDGGTDQQWKVLRGAGSTVMLRAVHSRKCLTVARNSLEPGALIVQRACTGSDRQLLKVRAGALGSRLRFVSSDLRLGIGRSSIGGDRVLTQQRAKPVTAQVWVFSAL